MKVIGDDDKNTNAWQLVDMILRDDEQSQIRIKKVQVYSPHTVSVLIANCSN